MIGTNMATYETVIDPEEPGIIYVDAVVNDSRYYFFDVPLEEAAQLAYALLAAAIPSEEEE